MTSPETHHTGTFDTATQGSGLGAFTGTSVKRVEDHRLLVGDGRYVADVVPPGCLHAAFVRSPFPHARLTGIDTSEATRLPGVVSVITGSDIEELTNPFLPFLALPGLYTPLYHSLSSERVRFVGDPVALVVASSRAVAEDAAELVDVTYEVLDGIGTIDRALDPESEPIWPRAKNNLLYDRTTDHGDVEGVFADADHVFTETFRCPRQSNQPMETRGILVEVDSVTGAVSVRAATQAPHMLRWQIAAYARKESGPQSIRSFLTNPERRGAFLAAAKAFVGDKGEALQSSDSTAMQHQLKTEPRTALQMVRTGAQLLGRDDYPHVDADDIGGGFGAKGSVAREEIAVAAAALAIGRSIQWIEDRMENLMDGGQAREEELTLSIACDADGTVRGLDVDLVLDQGAYPGNPVGAPITVRIMEVMQPGAYRFEAFRQRSRIVATNKGKYVAYRGPWANETWARERMINVVARRLGLSQTEIRRKNMYGDEDWPAAMLTGPALDVTCSVRKTLERAEELADLDRLDALRADAVSRGKRLGIGFASYHEAAPGPPDYFEHVNPGTSALLDQPATASVSVDGTIQIWTSQMPHGQSHETTYAQLAADQLGVAIEDIELVYGDTSRAPFDLLGTGGSRGGPVGGGAVRKVGRHLRSVVVAKAADMLEASVDDVTIERGNIHVAGVPARGLTYAEVAARVVADGETVDGRDGTYAFSVDDTYTSAGDGGWSVATHVCWVEVDVETGIVEIPRYLVVEDCGPIINPAIVDGQVRGGVAQGIGAVLYERAAYDEQANPQASTYMDYLIPTATEIPRIEVDHMETLSPGENDHRGVGEGGMIGAPAAITNAIEDAIGVTVNDQHLPPYRILELMGIIRPD